MHFLNKLIVESFPNELNAEFYLKEPPLSSHFSLKDKTNKEHIHNLVYKITCPEATCQQTYVGETGHRLSHAGYMNIAMISIPNFINTSPPLTTETSIDNVTILNHSCKGIHYRKVAEALYVKQIKPQLNNKITPYHYKNYTNKPHVLLNSHI